MNDAFHALVRGDRSGPLPTLKRFGLWSLSLAYGVGATLRNRAFERGWKTVYHAGVPVVSVGNLTVGGTGKTPCVEYVARYFRGQDLRVALLSRGYGSKAGRNDEALVLEENLPDVPHLQGPDRAALARTACEELESEVLVLDDAFQHRSLHRDLDLVLIDATCPWGHGYVLPRGLLREPIAGLRRADAVIVTRCDQVERGAVQAIWADVERVKPGLPVLESVHRPASWRNASRHEMPLEALRDRPCAGFCGLGNPEAFRRTLQTLGLNIVAWRTYPDHHPYSRDDVEDLRSWARQLPADATLVTTQKDLVKIGLDRMGERELQALRIQLEVTTGADTLEQLLKRSLTAMPRGATPAAQ